MNPGQPLSVKALVLIVVGVILLAAASTFMVTVPLSGGSMDGAWSQSAELPCDVPQLAGGVVDVTLIDSGYSMMGGWPMMVGVRAQPQTVPAGAVSLLVRNRGQMVHELTVMRVLAGGPGSRRSDSDGTVAEEGSLGHAEAACGTGEGDGIPPGGTSWLTLELRPGQYELICNEPWHYRAGMYEVLTVT